MVDQHPWGDASPASNGEVTDEERRQLVEKLADEVVARGLAAPAIFLLESAKPFSFLGSQALVFLSPIVKSFLNLRSYDVMTEMLEDRRNVEWLLQEIEKKDAEAQQLRKAARRERKKERGRRRQWRRRRET
jgi:hypothetical protein